MPVDRASREGGASRTHPGEEELARFFRGELPGPEARRIVRHLLTHCPRCSEVTRRLWQLGDGASGPDLEGDEEGGEE
jgi:hypothetical protein